MVKIQDVQINIWSIIIGLLILTLIWGYWLLVAIVPAGTVGVQDTFGDVADNELQSGFNFKGPFTIVKYMSIKTQEIKETASVPSKEGLIVNLEVSLLYKIDGTKANEIYKTIGSNYEEVVLTPQFRSVIREVTATYEAKALYSEGRELVELQIEEKLGSRLKERGIILEKVLLRDLGLPETVTNAIESKLEAEQEIEKQEFLVEKEKQEAARRIVEAEGISKANEIIANSLTPEYLRWYAIQRLNPNVDLIYLPADGGLPLIKTVE